METQLKTCPSCRKKFTPWRGKIYCSERCRKRAQNLRLGYARRDGATPVANRSNAQKILEQNQGATEESRRDERSYFGRDYQWEPCNEITQKFCRPNSAAVGWVMQIESKGWFGRVKDDRGDYSFGPSSIHRTRKAVEAWLRHEPFDKLDGESMWRGDCTPIL